MQLTFAVALLLMPALGTTAPALTGVVAADSHARPDVQLHDGWRWELPLAELDESWRSYGWIRFVPSGVMMLNEGPDGAIYVLHVRTDELLGAQGSKAPEYRVHVSNRAGDALVVNGTYISAKDDMQVARYRLDTGGDPDSVARIGLAVLTFEGRKEQSVTALRQAHEAGADVLPLPIVGEPYEFDLPLIGGGRVSSSELRGSVVLIDGWATWCGPCMRKMPDLKALHAKYADRGLVVIGVNFDQNLEQARTAIESGGLDWRHVHAPTSARGIEDLWERATGINAIPRLLLIDRTGVLRDDFYPQNMDERVEPLLNEASQVSLSGLRFTPHQDWTAEEPPSKARVAQFRLPGTSAGDDDQTQLIVYYFGESGAGTIESNIARWIDQIRLPDGGRADDVAATEARQINGLAVHTVDVAGTYVAETRPGSGERLNRPGQRLLAAVVRTDAGPYYFKLLGPAADVERWVEAWQALLESLHPASLHETDAAEHG